MNAARIDAILDLLSDEELREVPRWIDVFERWNMSTADAEEWRRRIVAKRAFLSLRNGTPPTD